MEPMHPSISHSPLFATLTAEELPHMLFCLNARRKQYDAKQFILREEDAVDDVGIILEGVVQIITEDLFGNRSITAKLGQGDLFGEVIASSRTPCSPVSVVAQSDCEILLLRFSKITTPCVRACAFHARVIENMMGVLAERNLLMVRKLSILSQRTIRDKLLAYLSWQSQEKESHEFTIPFTREELADYLCVNRSALSREISAMADEGLLASERSHFMLFNTTMR